MRNQDAHQISVLIVSHSHIMRSGLRRILESEASIRVLGDVSVEMATGAKTAQRQHPELLLVDLDSHCNDISRAIDSIQKTFMKSAILVLSDLTDHELARKALSLGAAGVVLKIQPPAVLIAAIQDLCPRYNSYRAVAKSPVAETKQTISQKFWKSHIPDAGEKLKIDSLTTREREIIRLIGRGLKNKDIANRLSISDITVRHHLTSIYCKLGVADRQKLLILSHRYGIADLALSVESA